MATISKKQLAAAILFEDNHILVVNKMPGVSIQADQTGDPPLVDFYREFRKQRDNKPGNVYLAPVHRLDRPVSGATIFAKTSKAASRLSSQFREGTNQKHYLAWLHPLPSDEEPRKLATEATLKDWIKKKPAGTSLIVPAKSPGGKESLLSYKIVRTGDRRILVDVELHTGRHHQIRLQFASRGWVVVGDKRYGAKRALPDRSIALHAASLALYHPVTEEWLCFTCDPPSSWLEWGPRTGG